MKLLIDDAHIDNIRSLYEYYPIDGVTTNPTILSKCGKDPYTVLKEIREFIGPDAELHVQAVSRTAEEMVKEAHKITEVLGKNTYVKIPSVKEGFKAMKQLKQEGYHITATAIYSPVQAFLAAKCGADYVAPYVNRIDNLGYDGIETVKEIQDMLVANDFKTGILAASFKNTRQVMSLVTYGIAAATLSPDVFHGMDNNKTVESAVDVFIQDFESLRGPGKTMLD